MERLEGNTSKLEYNLHNFWPFGQENYKPQNLVLKIKWNKKFLELAQASAMDHSDMKMICYAESCSKIRVLFDS